MKPEEIRPGRRYVFDYGRIYEVVQIYLNYRRYGVVDYVDEKGYRDSMPLSEFALLANSEISKDKWGG